MDAASRRRSDGPRPGSDRYIRRLPVGVVPVRVAECRTLDVQARRRAIQGSRVEFEFGSSSSGFAPGALGREVGIRRWRRAGGHYGWLGSRSIIIKPGTGKLSKQRSITRTASMTHHHAASMPDGP